MLAPSALALAVASAVLFLKFGQSRELRLPALDSALFERDSLVMPGKKSSGTDPSVAFRHSQEGIPKAEAPIGNAQISEEVKGAQSNASPGASPGKADLGEVIADAMARSRIDFYGILRDQDGKPVENGKVRYFLLNANGDRSNGAEGSLISANAAGEFDIVGERGMVLSLQPDTKGYRGSPYSVTFKYFFEKPPFSDREHRIAVNMWRLKGAEPLVKIEKHLRLVMNQEPERISLVDLGGATSAFDLKLGLSKQNYPDGTPRRYAWGYSLIVEEGGVIPTTYSDMSKAFELPEGGYKREISETFAADDPQWQDGIQRYFFLKSRNGAVFAKVGFDIGVDRGSQPAWLTVKGSVNTNASRNFEAE